MKLYLNKLFSAFALILLCLTLYSIPVHAEEDGIDAIDVTAVLHSDGSADITEVWKIDNAYDDTEYYKALYNLDEMSVSDFQVSDETGRSYELINEWDTDASFEEKAYRCGIVSVKKGYELCWGISSMGDHTYTISYHLTNLVKDYQGTDGFYYRFISDELSSAPESASVRIRMDDVPLNSSNAEIWAFGFDGEIQFQEGQISAWADQKLGSSDYINVMVRFSNGIFQAAPHKDTFEKVYEDAFNRDKVRKNIIWIILAVIVAIVLIGSLILFIATRNIRLADGSKTRRIPMRRIEPSSTLPFQNSIPAVCRAVSLDYMLGIACEPIAAYIVKWQLNGILTCQPESEKNDKPGDPVLLLGNAPAGDRSETELFELFSKAAKDGRVTLKRWGKWVEKNPKKIEKWQKNFEKHGTQLLIQSGWAVNDDKQRLRPTASGYQMMLRMAGFYKYLKAFKKPDEQTEAPRDYWGDYLIYASLFNLSKQVSSGLQHMDSDGFDQYCSSYNMNSLLFLYMINNSHSYASTTTAYSTGSGGSSYSSGGGGFSGGGGGGSR